jgi:hypothetical protein
VLSGLFGESVDLLINELIVITVDESVNELVFADGNRRNVAKTVRMRLTRYFARLEVAYSAVSEVFLLGVFVAFVGLGMRAGEIPMKCLGPRLFRSRSDLLSVERIIDFRAAQSIRSI